MWRFWHALRRLRKVIWPIVMINLVGCAEQRARLDDSKCLSYGAQPGSPAYVNCRAQLDAARTVAGTLE